MYISDSKLSNIQNNLQVCLNEINNWYNENCLKINITKTNVMLISTRHSKNKGKLEVKLNGEQLKQVNSVRYLGVEVDSNLTWNVHVKYICRSIYFKLHALRHLSSTLQTDLLNTLYKTTIQPCIDYACSVWGNCSLKNRELIRRLQRRAARIVMKEYDFSKSCTDLMKKLKWQSFDTRRDYFLCILAYQCIYGLAPVRLCNDIELFIDRHGMNTRNADSLNAVLPKPNIECFKQSFKYSAIKTRNSLPNELQNTPYLVSFKRSYKNMYFIHKQ